MQFRILIALALVGAVAGMSPKTTKSSTGVKTTETTVAGKAVKVKDYKYLSKASENGQVQAEKGDELAAAAGAVKMDKAGIMASIKAKSGANTPKEWASRLTKIRTQMSTVTKVDTNVKVDKNIINENAFPLEAASVLKNKFPEPVDFDKLSLSMQRKVSDLTVLTGQIASFSGKFFPKIVEMVAKVKLQKAHLKAEAAKGGSKTKTTKGVVAEQVIDEKLLSEDRAHLELLLATHNDLVASAKLGEDSLNKLTPGFNKLMGEARGKFMNMGKTCFMPLATWGKKTAADITAVTEKVKSCKAPAEAEMPDWMTMGGFEELGQVSSGIQEQATFETERTTDEKVLLGAKLTAGSSYSDAINGGGARFKSGDSEIIAKIKRDDAMIGKDQVEVQGLDAIATTRTLRGASTANAFLEAGAGGDIITKAKTGFAGGFGTGTTAGSNKVANSIYKKTAEKGDVTLEASKKSDVTVDAAKADYTGVETAEKILAGLDKANPRTQATKDELSSAGHLIGELGLDNSHILWNQGENYVADILKKAESKPRGQAGLLPIANKHAARAEVDKAITLVDTRLKWLRDSMTEMSKYYIWAQGELKRGVTVQTITDMKTYKTVMQKIVKDKQATAVDSSALITQMIDAFVDVQKNVNMVVKVIKQARDIINRSNMMVIQIKRTIKANGDACTGYAAAKVELVKKVTEKNCEGKTEIITLLTAISTDCSTVMKNPSCLSDFEAWLSSDKGKNALLEGFRKTFAVYSAIIGAFREASGQ